MTTTNTQIHPFISYLLSIKQAENRGALAALRRGVGKPPGSSVEMYRYIIPWLSNNPTLNQETAHYLIASLFALHPESTNSGNIGTHLAQTIPLGGEGKEALERRFTILLSSDMEELPVYLRLIINFLKSKNKPINWNQLYYDVLDWERDDRRVQKHWARAFWGNTPD